MTQRTRNIAWHKWWRQLVLPTVTVASAALVALALWHHQGVWPGVPRALAQTTDAVPDESQADSALDEAPAQPTDHIPAEARRRHVGANSVWMHEAHVPPPVAHEPLLDVPAAVPAPLDEDTAARVRNLLAQHERMQQAMPQDAPPPEVLDHLAGPPRMDSGDPNPDRLQGPEAHPELGQNPGPDNPATLR